VKVGDDFDGVGIGDVFGGNITSRYPITASKTRRKMPVVVRDWGMAVL